MRFLSFCQPTYLPLYILLLLSINVNSNINLYWNFVSSKCYLNSLWYSAPWTNSVCVLTTILFLSCIIMKHVNLSNMKIRIYFLSSKVVSSEIASHRRYLPLAGASIRHPTPCFILNLHLGSVVIRAMLIWNSSFLVPRTHQLPRLLSECCPHVTNQNGQHWTCDACVPWEIVWILECFDEPPFFNLVFVVSFSHILACIFLFSCIVLSSWCRWWQFDEGVFVFFCLISWLL
jgi:hypothetical protein